MSSSTIRPTSPSRGAELRDAAHRLEDLSARTPAGEWETVGLLASRPEVIARHDDGTTEHVADTRARTAAWIVGLSPRVIEPLIAWLRATADAVDAGGAPEATTTAALTFAEAVTGHIPPPR